MPKLTAEHLSIITEAGELLQRLIESGNLEEGTNERHCFNGLSLFFKGKDITEWHGQLTFEEWHIITQQTLPYLERIIGFRKLFCLNSDH